MKRYRDIILCKIDKIIMNAILPGAITDSSTYIRTIIASILISVVTYMMKRFTEYEYTWINMNGLEEYFTNKHSLVIEGEKIRTIMSWGGSETNVLFTPRFNAIWNFITNNVQSNYMIRSMREVLKPTTDSTKPNEEVFVVNQHRSFRIDQTREIYANVTIDNKNERNDKIIDVSRTCYIITLYSYTERVKDIIDFVDGITHKYIASLQTLRENKQFIYTLERVQYSEDILSCWSEHEFNSNFMFDNIFFNGKNELINKLDFFLHNKDWYANLGIPYTLGIGLHGPPGTGKTSLVKCIANYTGRHIIVLSLKLIKTRKQLFEFFYEQRYNRNNSKPISFENKIILLEDIDCCTNIVLQRRTHKPSEYQRIDIENQCRSTQEDAKKTIVASINPEEPITLDDILNLWDGIRETPGRIMIITSNHYNKLDAALVRPGRIDITLELKNADRKIIGDMYKHLFRKTMPARVLSKIPDYKYSPASIMNKYISCKNNSELFTQSLLEELT